MSVNRFVFVADSYTWKLRPLCQLKKKLISQVIEQRIMSIIFSAYMCMACRFQPMQMTIYPVLDRLRFLALLFD